MTEAISEIATLPEFTLNEVNVVARNDRMGYLRIKISKGSIPLAFFFNLLENTAGFFRPQ